MKREEVFASLEKRGDSYVKKADESYVRVMTCNVLFSNATKPCELDYLGRTDILAGMCAYYQPDFVGFQEVTPEMKAAFVERFSDIYSFVESPVGERFKRGKWIPHVNYTPLAYNKHRYELLNHRYNVFPIPECWSYQWALYADKQNPARRYLHMNLHYYPIPGAEQLPGVCEVHRELTYLRRQYGNTPIFVTGDYNCARSHPNFARMLEGLHMESGMLLAEDVEEKFDEYWCHEPDSMELQKGGKAIDHITVTTDLCNVKMHRVLHDELLCKSSDHCARFLDIEIKEKTI